MKELYLPKLIMDEEKIRSAFEKEGIGSEIKMP
jgi:hypothetical protein